MSNRIINVLKMVQVHEQNRQQLFMSFGIGGESETAALSPCSGIVICVNNLPLVNEGEAIYHIARFDELGEAEKAMNYFRSSYESDTGDAVVPVYPWD